MNTETPQWLKDLAEAYAEPLPKKLGWANDGTAESNDIKKAAVKSFIAGVQWAMANREKELGEAWDAAEEATKNACGICDCALGPHVEFDSTTEDKASYIEQVKNKQIREGSKHNEKSDVNVS
jgi:hypothetical protein